MSGIGSGGDIVLLLLSLVLSYYQSCGARAGEVGDDGRAHGHDEILDECFHVWVHTFLLPPFNFPSSYKKRKRRTRIGTWSLGYNLMHLILSLSCLRLTLSCLRHSLSCQRLSPDALFHFSNWRNIFLQLGKWFSSAFWITMQRYKNSRQRLCVGGWCREMAAHFSEYFFVNFWNGIIPVRPDTPRWPSPV